MKRWMMLMILFLGFSAQVLAKITLELDASHLALGDNLRLTLTYDPSEVHGIPDLTPLQADFVILATEQSTSYTVINGQARSTGQWGIVLQAKKAGTLVIPPIVLGTGTTSATQVVVTPVKGGNASDNKPQLGGVAADGIKLSAQVSDSSPYLHQEVLYTVRLLNRQRLMNVQYHHPQVDNAILLPLGEGRQYQTTVSGVVYNVDEQRYALFAQKSGPMTIEPPSLQAIIYDRVPKPVTVHAKALTIKVKPLPKHQSIHDWLPSKLVRLRETYNTAATTLSQGATVERTITLQAQGLVAQLLPTLKLEQQSGFSLYTANPEPKTDIKQGELWGASKLKVTYVFTQPGAMTLPEISVPWFNIKTKTIEKALLPAKTFQIIATASSSPKPRVPTNIKTLLKHRPSEYQPMFRLLGYGLGGAALAGAGVMVIVGLYRRRARAYDAKKVLREACLSCDPLRAKSALEAWARQRWPEAVIVHLADIYACVDDSVFHEQLSCLITALYQSKPVSDWHGEALWQAIIRLHTSRPGAATKTSKLPPIHPKRTVS